MQFIVSPLPLVLALSLKEGCVLYIMNTFWTTVLCLPVLSILSMTLVYCVQTVGRIKMKLGTQIGLCPGHIALDGNPVPPPIKRGWIEPPNFRPMSVVAK